MRRRNAVEREREALARKHMRRDSEEFERVLKADATTERFLEAMREKFGDDHGAHVMFDAHTGWYGVERNGKKAHYRQAELDRLSDRIYAELHEQELGHEDDK